MFTTYEEAVNHLFAALPMFHRQGAAAYKADLSVSLALDKQLNFPHQAYHTIHVAGTNGKGSVCSLLASIFQEAGYKVGLFTSPHIHDFRERMRVNGELIEKSFVLNWMNSVYPKLHSIPASFFELTTFMAFEAFNYYEVDIAIIEVGMGGRLDTTNVIQPVLSIITNISLDHTQFLGNTVEAIAIEKAGIIKQDTPVIIGNSSGVPHVFEQIASDRKAGTLSFADTILHERLQSLQQINPLRGAVQLENLNTVMHACELLQHDFNIQDNIEVGIQNVLQNTGLKGRMELLSTSPEIIADVGHNLAGFQSIITQLQQEWGETFQNWHFVLTFVADKDLSQVLTLLPKESIYHLAKASIPRGMELKTLQQEFQQLGFQNLYAYPSVQEAFDSAMNHAMQNKKLKIFVGGSFFTLADLHV